jgi:hypothetical protein
MAITNKHVVSKKTNEDYKWLFSLNHHHLHRRLRPTRPPPKGTQLALKSES